MKNFKSTVLHLLLVFILLWAVASCTVTNYNITVNKCDCGKPFQYSIPTYPWQDNQPVYLQDSIYFQDNYIKLW